MSSITRLWYDNPVFVKELRARMRGTRAYWLLAGYLAVLSGVLFFSYVGWWNTARTGGGLSEIGSVGTWFYQIMIAVEAFLVVFIAPSITAASLTVEREQRTMDLLAVTPIARIHIVVGKLLAASASFGLLLSASCPLCPCASSWAA
jgi:ABC-type Na+ efflux pump, permease component